MNFRFHFVFVALFAVMLAACSQQDLRSQASTTLTAAIDIDGCQPARWVVPGGAAITATFTNDTTNTAQWDVLIYPATPPYDGMDKENFFIAFSIPANTTHTEEFTAPAMPGEYQVLCSQASKLDKTPKATLVVVQP